MTGTKKTRLGADGAVTSDVEVSGSKADLHSYLLKEKQIVGWPKPYLDVPDRKWSDQRLVRSVGYNL